MGGGGDWHVPGYIPRACIWMLDVRGLEGRSVEPSGTLGRRESRASSGLYCAGNTRVDALAVDPYHLMVASHGHDPRHDLFLLGVACASTLLPYAVGITVTASTYDSTHHRSAIPQRTQRNIIEAHDAAVTGANGIY